MSDLLSDLDLAPERETVREPAKRRVSDAERALRAAVVDRLRAILPDGRIVHELVCEPCRADIAVIQPERLTLFELKSERDKLDRCERQMETFVGAGHAAVLVADTKWFDKTPYTNGAPRCVWPEREGHYARYKVWHYPEPEANTPEKWYGWRLDAPCFAQPAPRVFLNLMWRAEMREECLRHGIAASPRANMKWMTDQMAYLMTGREIARAVCRQLRKRSFPEADPPIFPVDENGEPL